MGPLVSCLEQGFWVMVGPVCTETATLGERTDASPVPVTVAETSGGSVVDGQGEASVGAKRPSLFSTSGSLSSIPFTAALASLSPEESGSRSYGCFGSFAKRIRKCRGCLLSS